MQLSRIVDAALGSSAKVKLLRSLLLDSKPKSGRTLAREVGMSHAQVLRVLAELSVNGLVRIERVGGTHAYSIQEHALPVTELLRPLFERERSLPDEAAHRIVAAVKTPTVAVSAFGSVVRQHDHAESDLDLIFIVETAAQQRKLEDELAGHVAAHASQMGVRLGPYVVMRDELARRFRARDAFTLEVSRTARCVSGKTLLEVISSGAKKAQNAKRRSQ